jgi:putative copper export protein
MTTLRQPPRTRVRRSPWALLAVLAVAVGGVVAMDPEQRHVPLCPFHSATGLQCPFCGSLRAVYSLAHGRVLTALHDNLLFVLAIPVAAWLWWDERQRRRRGAAERHWSRAVWVSVVALLVVFTVVRNLPAMALLRPV